MSKLIPAILLVFVIIYFVPFLVYSLGTVVAGLEQPEGSPARFLLGILAGLGILEVEKKWLMKS